MENRTKSVRVRFENRQVCDYTDVKNRESLKCRMENFSVTEDDSFEPIGNFPEMSFRLRTEPHQIADIDMPEHDFTLAPVMPVSGFGRYDYNPMETDFVYNVVMPQDRALESYRAARAAGGNPQRPTSRGINVIQAQMAGIEMADYSINIPIDPAVDYAVDFNDGNLDEIQFDERPTRITRNTRNTRDTRNTQDSGAGVIPQRPSPRATVESIESRTLVQSRAPARIEDFLAGLGLDEHSSILRSEGFDDVNTISRYDRTEADEMRRTLTNRGVPLDDVNRILRGASAYNPDRLSSLYTSDRPSTSTLQISRRPNVALDLQHELERRQTQLQDENISEGRVKTLESEIRVLERQIQANNARRPVSTPVSTPNQNSNSNVVDEFPDFEENISRPARVSRYNSSSLNTLPDAVRHSNNARSQAVRLTGSNVNLDIPMIEMIDINVLPSNRSTLDPMRPRTSTGSSIPEGIIQGVQRIMPVELPPTVTEQIPYPPDPTRAGMLGYEVELANYNIRLQRLFTAIDRVTPEGQDRWLLRRQIELHIETVRLRAQGGVSGITPDTRQLEVQFGIYNRLARTPIADRPSIHPTTGELYLPDIGIGYLPEDILRTTRSEYLTTAHPNSGISVSDVNAAFEHIHSEFGRVVSQFPHVPAQPITQPFAITAQREMSFVDSMRNIRINPMQLAHGGSNFAGNIIVGMLVGSALEQSDAFHGMIGAAGMGAISGAASSVAGLASETIIARGAASSARFAALALPSHMALNVAGASSASAAVSLSRNILQHAAQGLIIGALLTPVDMMFQDYLIRHGFSQVGAGALSGAVTGALGVGAAAGIAAGVASFNAGALTTGAAAAPETFGLSMAVAIGSIALSSAIGALAGVFSEHSAREDRNRHNANRMAVMNSLPQYNWDWNAAQQAWEQAYFHGTASDRDSNWAFGDYRTEMRPFRDMIEMRFNGRMPAADSPLHQEPPSLSNTERRTMDLMRVAMNYNMAAVADSRGNHQLAQTIRSQPGYRAITPEEYVWLDDTTHFTWEQEVDLMASIEYGQLEYDAHVSQDASVRLYAAWENNHSLPDPESADYRLANLNPNFQANFIHNIGIDAQRIIIQNFQTAGLALNQNTIEVQAAALLNDLSFVTNFNNYSTEMNTTAARYNITVQQLVALQQEPNEAVRARQFQTFQYNTLAANTNTVHEAAAMAIYLTQVRGQGFYDRDQYEMDSDPDSINTWNPLDSQIYQAHELGMTMQQYIDYLHQLGLGAAGSFNNLPEYTPDELAAQRALDLEHFNAELLMSGNTSFSYNPETFMWRSTNPDGPPGNRRILITDPYLPANFESSTQSFHNMIHGQNLQNQADVDAYNASLLNELDRYEMSFYDTANPYNTYVQNFGGQYRHFDRAGLYNSRAAIYTPASENIRDYITVINAGHTTTASRADAMNPALYTRVDYQGTTLYFDNQYYNSLDPSTREDYYATFARSIAASGNGNGNGSGNVESGRRQLTPGRVLSINASGQAEEIDANDAGNTSMYSQITRNGQTIYLNTNYRNYLMRTDTFDSIDSVIETFNNTPAPQANPQANNTPANNTPANPPMNPPTLPTNPTNPQASNPPANNPPATGGRIDGGHERIDDGF